MTTVQNTTDSFEVVFIRNNTIIMLISWHVQYSNYVRTQIF